VWMLCLLRLLAVTSYLRSFSLPRSLYPPQEIKEMKIGVMILRTRLTARQRQTGPSVTTSKSSTPLRRSPKITISSSPRNLRNLPAYFLHPLSLFICLFPSVALSHCSAHRRSWKEGCCVLRSWPWRESPTT
jgi:hypothetical protein